jgi:hypothetical protein
MPHGEDSLLDRVAFGRMPADVYCRVHPAALPGHSPVDPRSANPYSRARLALRREVVTSLPELAMFYAASTAAGALFEAPLRNASVGAGRQVYLARQDLHNQCLSRLQLQRELPIIPLGLPDRKSVVTDPQRDARWRELINTPDHHDTHVAAAAVYAQVRAAGHEHTGLSWPSVQAPPATVFLLYQPPLQRADWHPLQTIALDTPAGETLIADALGEAGYTWLADPSGPGYTPDDPDAL